MNIIHFFTVTDPNLNLAEIDEWIFAQELEAFRLTTYSHTVTDSGHTHSVSYAAGGFNVASAINNHANMIMSGPMGAIYSQLYTTEAFVFKDSEAATLFKLQYGDGCDHKVEERKDCARNYGNDFTNWIYKI
ncbi:hypothetical protein [Burkholderia multivorans]|uniref:hypothetical protein n=1 Tax=Burkholderia multivorans TaxID=87883 RepID=UPI00159075F0|nr:hypothetical protein [Burkholderia multivorans]